MIVPVLISLLLQSPAPAPDTVLVCPRGFHDAMQTWVAYRTGQGHDVTTVLSDGLTVEQIREEIRKHARGGRLRYVVLAGDALPGASAAYASWLVPTQLHDARVNTRWGSEPQIASDHVYGDLDDDGVPELAVGRLSADHPTELTAIIEKTIRYEQASMQGWQRRISLVAGTGGFGPLVDPLLENITARFLTNSVPPGYDTQLTYGNWRSAYCPDPRQFRHVTLSSLQQGSLFWIYVGHGHRLSLAPLHFPGGHYPVMDVRDMRLLQGNGRPVAVLLSCYTGAYDGRQDCLAEEMLASPGGPVAVLAGSRVTMPYAMSVLTEGLLHACFQQPELLEPVGDRDAHARPTLCLGNVVLAAKQRMCEDRPADVSRWSQRHLVDVVARWVSPNGDALDDERREHVLMFNLLGDPLLRMPVAHTLQVEAPQEVRAGQTCNITVRSPLRGKCRIELVCRRDQLRFDFRSRSRFDPAPAALAGYQETHRRANDRAWSVRESSLNGEYLICDLEVPEDAAGPSHIVVTVEGESGWALGTSDLRIRP